MLIRQFECSDFFSQNVSRTIKVYKQFLKVITLNKTQFQQQCAALFNKIEFQPNLVIGVLNGGGYVLEDYKRKNTNTSICFETVKLQRKTTKGIKQNGMLKQLLKVLPYAILDKMRISEFNRSLKAQSKSIIEPIEIQFDSAEKKDVKNILILDDALDTGMTMQSVIHNLQRQFPGAIIKTAVVVWTNTASHLKPDFYNIKDNLVRFPWSLDYKTNRDE